MSLVERFAQQVHANPQSLALTVLGSDNEQTSTHYSWHDLGRLVTACQHCLLEISSAARVAGHGVHVATWLPNGLAWVVVDLALQSLGWVHVAIDKRLPSKLAAELVVHSQSRFVIGDDQPGAFDTLGIHALNADEVVNCQTVGSMHGELPRAPLIESQPAQILYTSGTMNQPKGVVLSHGNLESNALAKLGAAPQYADDVRLNVLPFAHAYARTCELSTWLISGSQLCIAADWRSLLDWAPIIRPTLINLVPHLAHKLATVVREDAAMGPTVLGPRMRLLQVGGAALPSDVWDTLAGAGWPPLQGYGLTETSPVVCSNRAGSQSPDNVGFPVAGVQLRVDQYGVLWTKGPQVMLGYWNDPRATAERIVDGWLCTGDLAALELDGSVRILGRADDQILLSTGYNVSPFELTQLLAHDAWIEHLVIVGQGRPYVAALVDPRWSTIPLELHQDHPRLEKLLLERWAVHWDRVPRWMQIQRVAILPKTLTVADGGLNFKGAVRRKFVEQQLYAQRIAELYLGNSLPAAS